MARFGELLLPRIHEAELQRRITGLRLLPYSPLGPDHPVALDGGLASLGLGSFCEGNATRLAYGVDAVIIAGSDVLTADDGRLGAAYGLPVEESRRRRLAGFFIEGPGGNCPVVWSAVGVPSDLGESDGERVRLALSRADYLSVRDAVSRRRLMESGIVRDISVVPDPVALAARVFPPDILLRRLDYLRFMEWFPREGSPVVVQGSRALVAHALSLAASLTETLDSGTPVVLLDTEPADGDGAFSDALAIHLRSVYRLPASHSLSDILAILSAARGFVGDSVHGHFAALAFGVPSLFISAGQATRPAALEILGEAAPAVAAPAEAGPALARQLDAPHTQSLPATLESRLDAHFDALADLADRALAGRFERGADPPGRLRAVLRAMQDADARLDATRHAWEIRSAQVASVKIALQERLEKLEAELKAARAEPNAARRAVEADLQTARQETAALRVELAASGAGRDQLAADLRTAESNVATIRSELATARTELEQLRPDLETLARFHQMTLTEVQALKEDCRQLRERLAEAMADSPRQVAGRDEQLGEARAELEALRAEFVRFTNLRLFRYTAPLRKTYAALRRALGLANG